jgi:hypothetical protein
VTLPIMSMSRCEQGAGLRGPSISIPALAGPFVAWAAPFYGPRIIPMSFPQRHPKRTGVSLPQAGAVSHVRSARSAVRRGAYCWAFEVGAAQSIDEMSAAKRGTKERY